MHVLLDKSHLEKALQMIECLKNKYEKDIFTIYETNLKIKSD